MNVLFTPLNDRTREVRIEFIIVPGYEDELRADSGINDLSKLLQPRNAQLLWLSPDRTYGVVRIEFPEVPSANKIWMARRKGR